MWFERIQGFYSKNLWTKEMVQDAVRMNRITADEYKIITGEDYIV